MFTRLCFLAFLIFTMSPAHAAWPERPVTVVVPFAAGGITDTLARLTAERLQATLAKPFVVENQAGAAGITATQRVARATPDGYTLLFTTISQIAIAPFTNKISYDPIKDFKPISIIATSPFVITTNADFPAKTLAQFVEYVKARPGQLTYGNAGPGSLSHLSSALFLKRANLQMTMVPYRGLAPAFADLIAGNVHMLSATPVELKPFLDGKRLQLLASSGPARSNALPDVPTIAETFPGHAITTWNGLVAPAKVPQDVVDTLTRVILEAKRNGEFGARLQQLGVDPVIGTPQEFEKQIGTDTEIWRKIIPELGLQPQ
jgi:tripartite-type tricarboxylate transporter receptor subunit TctC